MDEMAKLPGLKARKPSGVFYYRVRVPKELVTRLGRKDIWVSLATCDPRVARDVYWVEAAKWQSLFAHERAQRSLSPKDTLEPDKVHTLSHEEAVALAKALVAERLANPDFSRPRWEYSEDAAHDIECEIDASLFELQSHSNSNSHQRIFSDATYLLRKYGYGNDVTASGQPELLHLVQRALIVLAREERARFSGDIPGNLQDALFADVTPGATVVQRVAQIELTVKAASESFWRERIAPEITSTKTELKYRAALRRVVEFFGPQTAIGTIKRDDCTHFRDVIDAIPSNFSKRFPAGLSLREIAKQAEGRGFGKMAFETQKTYLNMMHRLLSWAQDGGHLTIRLNHIKPLVRKTPNEEKRLPFTAKQLNAIFHTPLYTGCINDERGFSKAGPNVIKRSRYWVPLIALFTGMRMGEILQLTTEHVRISEHGAHFFLLTRDMQLKNLNSRREVPIHSTLIDIGFLEFVEKARRAKRERLFDDVPLASDGTFSTLFSKRFAYFLKASGLKKVSVDDCFHMFRHTLKDALSAGDVPEEFIEQISGWSRGGKMVRNYGSGLRADTLQPWIEKLKLPKGVELSHLLV